jgi:predicted component of type VI protein secretion system
VLILTVMQGPDKGRKFELPDHEPQLIGRSSEALPLTDNTVSRRHAELTPDDGLWWIRDLQSQNGSYVNGHRITERTRLKPGDQVRTGATLFVFGAAEPGEADIIRLVGADLLSADIEQTLASNEDSVILAEPEPSAAAGRSPPRHLPPHHADHAGALAPGAAQARAGAGLRGVQARARIHPARRGHRRRPDEARGGEVPHAPQGKG